MSVTLGALKTTINDIRADDTNGTVDIDVEGVRAINYILSDLNNKHDWEGSIDEYTLRYFPVQTRYALPTDWKALITLYPVLNHVDDFLMKSPAVFNRKLITGFPDPMVSVEEGRYRRMHISYPYTRAQSIVLSSNSSFNDNGTWVGTDDATGVRTDNQQFTENNGSVAFNVTVASSVNNYATMTKTMAQPIDMTDYRNSTVFVNFDISSLIPNIKSISGFTMRIGSSASDYYEVTVTRQEDGTAYAKGINRLAFDLESATTTGAPLISEIDHIMIRMNYGVSMTDVRNFRFGQMTACNYEPLVIQYYTNKMVYDVSADEYVTKFDGTDDSDYALLPEDADIVVESGASYRLLLQMEQMENAEFEQRQYSDRRKNLESHYPSRRKRPEAPSLVLTRW